MLFRYAIFVGIARYSSPEPLPSLIECPGAINILSIFNSHMFSIDYIFKRLSVVNPLERTKPISDWNDTECLNMKISVHASCFISEYCVHYLEKLLHSLIKS